MMKKLPRVIMLCLLLTLVFACVAGATTHTGTCGTSATWSFDDATGVLTIGGTGNVSTSTSSGNVTAVPWNSFRSQITELVIEDGITSVSNYTFWSLSVNSMTIPASLTNILGYAFPQTAEFVVDEENPVYQTIDGVLYKVETTEDEEGTATKTPYELTRYTAASSDTTYEVPEGITTIGDWAFGNSKNLAKIVIPDNVIALGNNMCQNCSALTEINIPKGIKEIPYSAFNGCQGLKNVQMAEGLETIGSSAFYYCAALEELAIPDTVVSIGNDVFRYCSALESISLSSELKSIGNQAFSGCSSLAEVVIPDGVSAIYSSLFDGCSALKSVTLPASLVSIGQEAFDGCTSLTELILPEGLTTIENYAFRDTAIESLALPASLSSVTGHVFYKCPAEITVAENSTYFSSVDGVVYTKDKSKLVVYPYGKADAEYTVLDGTKDIAKYAFYYSHLNTLTIPASIDSIEKSAFFGGAITGLYFYGEPPQTDDTPTYAIGTDDLTVYYIEGTEGWGDTWWDFTTATWTPENAEIYTVTYDLNGGTGTIEAQTKTAGTKLTLRSHVPFKTGHTFLGWGLSANAQEATYHPGDIYTEDAEITLYALWEPATYTITFDVNGGENIPESITKTHGVDVVLPGEELIRTYYNFLGWSASQSATTATYKSGDTYSGNADITLYAVWEAVTYSVLYDANGGQNAPGAQTKTAGVDMTITADVPTKAGYEFLGWAVSQTAAEADYLPEDIYTSDADVTLYALWKQIVTGDDGVVTLSSVTAAPGDTVTLTASISNNQGMAGFLFEIRADQNVFSVTTTDGELNITAGNVCTNGTLLSNTSENGWKVMWYHTANVKTDGELFTIEFTVAEDAPDGEYTIDLICSEDDTVNVEEELVPLTVNDGTVNVSSIMVGDVTGDGKITNSDVIKLARYLIDLTTLTDQQLAAADANGDGRVTNSDVIKLARYLVGLTTL